MSLTAEILVPHLGWLRHEAGDDVALFLQQGWFEAREQAMAWLYLRAGDTFIDCGAHVGLFSVLAGRAVDAQSAEGGGRVISIEPEPATAALLRENLQINGIERATVITAGITDHTGTMRLHQSGAGRSAYNTLSGSDDAPGVDVRVLTLDELLDEQQVERAAFLKIDVEGLELNVWRGAQRSIERGALPLVMIEFTEENLQRAGHSTLELARAVEEAGYMLCRFDVQSLQLAPARVEGPIGYDNLFAVRNLAEVNQRLSSADEGRRRIAGEILRRAEAAQVAQEAEGIRRRFAELQQFRDAALARIERMTHDLERVLARAEHAERSHEQTGQTLRQTQEWLKITTERALKAEQRARDAEALQRSEAEAARAREQCLTRQLDETRQLVSQLSEQLFAFVTSKYEQLSWKLGVRKKPEWVDAFVEQHLRERAAPSPPPAAPPPAQPDQPGQG